MLRMKSVILILGCVGSLTMALPESGFGQNRVEFFIENRRAVDGVYFAQLWANVPDGVNPWFISGINLIVSFNSSGLDATNFNNQNVFEPNGQIHNTNGYQNITQTRGGSADRISMNVLKISEPFEQLTGSLLIGTFRWTILDPSQTDNIQFESDQSQVFSGLNQLDFDCGMPSCYGFSSPPPLTLNAAPETGGGQPVVEVVVSPNPTAGDIEIDVKTDIGSDLTIFITDVKGVRLATIHTGPYRGNTLSANLEPYPIGAYFVIVQTSEGETAKKVQKIN